MNDISIFYCPYIGITDITFGSIFSINLNEYIFIAIMYANMSNMFLFTF